MKENLTTDVAYDNGTYQVVRLEYLSADGEDEDDGQRANWAIVNNKYATVEQLAFVLPGAVQTADTLKDELDKCMPKEKSSIVTMVS